VGRENIQIVHYFDHGYLEEEKSMIQALPTKFVGGAYHHQKSPLV
jgi:hypothetical protein